MSGDFFDPGPMLLSKVNFPCFPILLKDLHKRRLVGFQKKDTELADLHLERS